jgi:uncharacterized protein YcbK (DUF882 family)
MTTLVKLRTIFSHTSILDLVLNALKRLKIAKNINIPMNLKHFKITEFASPDEVGSGAKMDAKFLQKLDQAREIAGCKFSINSGYRTQEHNLKVGGRFGSSHKLGLAADIHYSGSRERFLILNALMKVGINRIGIGGTFIHADLDIKKDNNVIWTYKY